MLFYPLWCSCVMRWFSCDLSSTKLPFAAPMEWAFNDCGTPLVSCKTRLPPVPPRSLDRWFIEFLKSNLRNMIGEEIWWFSCDSLCLQRNFPLLHLWTGLLIIVGLLWFLARQDFLLYPPRSLDRWFIEISLKSNLRNMIWSS